MIVSISEKDIIDAAQKSSDAFVDLVAQKTLQAIGGQLTADTMPSLTADQITLLAYQILKQEVMEGGFTSISIQSDEDDFASSIIVTGAVVMFRICSLAIFTFCVVSLIMSQSPNKSLSKFSLTYLG